MNWQDKLVGAIPRLSGAPARASPECNEGWRELLECCCSRIESALQPDETLTIKQIKEKYATLRFYYDGKFSQATRQKIDNAIALAEARSAVTCEICGADGRLYRHGAWYMTRRTAHERGRQVPAKPDRENLLISYGYEGGQLRVVACQRYDRATDSFTPVDPASVGLNEEWQET